MNKIILPTFFMKNKIYSGQIIINCIIYSYTVDTVNINILQK